ncbi:CLUMA_CG007395, isoform A [Clunio marinus]|uniref:CLUMA_CG007395, isoform A n=1 Tax=Clunio marinus TaxID=568069 RepID=A0A1J1I2Q3_9DIPT|nr:CLUMA_CG007395, isoform A [Clunio marinus]
MIPSEKTTTEGMNENFSSVNSTRKKQKKVTRERNLQTVTTDEATNPPRKRFLALVLTVLKGE